MHDVTISPEVEARIGPEQARRYRTEPALSEGQCWDCGDQASVRMEPVSVLCLIREHLAGVVNFAHLAHTRCSPSEIRHLSAAELEERRRAEGITGEEPAGDVTALAAVWPAGPDEARPVVLMSFGEIATYAESGDRIDAVTSHLLGQGWHLVTRMGRAPDPAPDGWRIRFTPKTSQAPGHFQLSDPHGQILADINPLQPGYLWLPAVYRTGQVAAYVAPLRLDTWTEDYDYPALQRTIKAGHVVGARIPIEVLRPSGQPLTLDP